MSNITTFSAYTIARLGIYAAQKGLNITGNNISNINTAGYTREVLNQKSLKTGGSDRYESSDDASIGNGVICTDISQERDPYLDIRYRDEQSSVGAMQSKLDGLDDISSILDEVGSGDDDNGVIINGFNDLVTQLETLSGHVGEEEYDSLVRSSASTLTQLFNSYANKLDTVQQDEKDKLGQDVTTVNNLLTNIRNLNSSIRLSAIHGDSALEMKDQRNQLIDQLSQYMKVDVNYGTEDIGGGQTIEKLVVKLDGNDPSSDTDNTTLIDGIYGSQLSLDNDSDNYSVVVSALTSQNGTTEDGSTAVELGDNDIYGAMQSVREMLTEKGEYATSDDISADSKAASKRGLPYYQHALDALANKFATVLNAANTVTDVSGNITMGGALFSNSGDSNNTTGITASNISISSSWSSGAVSILNSTHANATSQDNTNIAHILYLMDADQDYAPSDTVTGTSDTVYFTGSFQDMFSNINTVLANDTSTTSTMLDNYSASSDELYSNRDSVSGVDLNDEATNLMQYQKAYSAACRVMTTVDDVLNKLINDTGASS